jgi:phosphatidate phosphatase APP1
MRSRLFSMLRLSAQPVVKAYDGYGDNDDVLVYGHVLSTSPMPRVSYRQQMLINFFSLIRLFIVKPVKGARVLIEWNGETRETVTDSDGLFKFEWKPLNHVKPGWSSAKITYLAPAPVSAVLASAVCAIFVPLREQFNFISDIDDTFLISHSSNLARRLRVLFTHNARSRQPFEGVARHYRILCATAGGASQPNPFFYVSSSEWNLYDYIREFCRNQGMPKGIFLLSQIKQVQELLATGQGRHASKYIRIARILKAYPNHTYILLGDDTQEDPGIYYAIVRDFPGKVGWVYIRQVGPAKKRIAHTFILQIESLGVKCCYFSRSEEALAHSVRTALVPAAAVKTFAGEAV